MFNCKDIKIFCPFQSFQTCKIHSLSSKQNLLCMPMISLRDHKSCTDTLEVCLTLHLLHFVFALV